MATEPTPRTHTPPLTSLCSWSAGRTETGAMQVRLTLTDPAEVRAWAAWLAEWEETRDDR